MTACIFLGPTLPVSEARQILDATYLPPVRQGDVLRAVHRFRPRVIGIVDGHFHQVPSVWHKEILSAMAEGVHVFGSASMGALRAAELHAFGMEGVGEVFAAFRDGLLEDDDEVAVVHGPADLDFIAASEAMVNIRRTLDAALAEGIIGAATRRVLTDIAKSLFYPDRAYPDLLKRGATAGCSGDELAAFDAWRPTGRVDIKRDDALHMLREITAKLGGDAPPKSVDYSVEHTTMWDAATSAIEDEDRGGASGDQHSFDTWLMDEIRLDDTAFDELWRAALLHVLALEEAYRQGLGVHEEECRQAFVDFRLDRRLARGPDLRAWLGARELDRSSLEQHLQDQLRRDKVTEQFWRKTGRAAIAELRLGDDYERLSTRARDKDQALAAVRDDQELTSGQHAITWYFQLRDGDAPPADLEAYARKRGFRDAADFRRAVMREFLYSHSSDETNTP